MTTPSNSARASGAGLALAASLLAGCYQTPTAAPADDPIDPACQYATPADESPGYPYDLETFAEDVLPVLTATCGVAGCHGAPAGTSGFTVWGAAGAAAGECDDVKTFNSLQDFVDLANPTNSRLFVAISGGLAVHPIKYAGDDPTLATFRGFLEAASTRYIEDGGASVTPPPGASPFDYAVFQATIQPSLDGAEGRGCAAVGCHGSGAGAFTLVANPTPDSPEMEANFLAVTAATSLAAPASSLVYLQATTRHAGGASALASGEQAAAMLAWIEAARATAGDDQIACVDAKRLDLGIFRDEIMPILRDPAVGCTEGACHGVDRGPGILLLDPAGPIERNLQSFACFVDAESPSSSDVVLCPLDDPGCVKAPHPGEAVFAGEGDAVYQRVLAFLYGTKAAAVPLDFAFFVRRVNPIFSDAAISDPQAGGRSCADANGCHGVQVAGQRPAGGAALALLANASDRARLRFNFSAALGFANPIEAGASDLLRYPTDDALVDHAGGEAFAPDGRIAADVLRWLEGLRPDGGGFQGSWLIAGDYPAATLDAPTPIVEGAVAPSIFDASGGQLLGGEWDARFDGRVVDLGAALPGEVGNGRAAYAVAYLLNTTDAPIDARLTLATENAARILIDGVVADESDDGDPLAASAILPPYRAERTTTRIVVKLVQRPGDDGFAFSLRLRDAAGAELGDDGDVIIRLDPRGGL